MCGKKICCLCWGPEADTNLQSHFKPCNGNSITGGVNRSCSLSTKKKKSCESCQFLATRTLIFSFLPRSYSVVLKCFGALTFRSVTLLFQTLTLSMTKPTTLSAA